MVDAAMAAEVTSFRRERTCSAPARKGAPLLKSAM